jgi:hypothetical protein
MTKLATLPCTIDAARFSSSADQKENSNNSPASEHSDLPLVWITELFHLGYVNANTRGTALSATVAILLSQVCNSFPESVSLLLLLVYHNFQYIGSAALPLFEDIDLTHWRPTNDDMCIIKELARHGVNSSPGPLAWMLLRNLNLAYQQGEELNAWLFEADRVADGSAMNEATEDVKIQPEGRSNMEAELSRPPVLGWSFHRDLLLLLAEIRFAHLEQMKARSGIQKLPEIALSPITTSFGILRSAKNLTAYGIGEMYTRGTAAVGTLAAAVHTARQDKTDSKHKETYSAAPNFDTSHHSASREYVDPRILSDISLGSGPSPSDEPSSVSSPFPGLAGEEIKSFVSPSDTWWVSVLVKIKTRNKLGAAAEYPLRNWYPLSTENASFIL